MEHNETNTTSATKIKYILPNGRVRHCKVVTIQEASVYIAYFEYCPANKH